MQLALAATVGIGVRSVLGMSVGVGVAWLSAATCDASPAMIRLGYSSCHACHLSPQGRGLLTEYGRAIDDAQSARKGVYRTDEQRVRRVFQDLRVLTQGSLVDSDDASSVGSATARLWYRNATAITRTMRFAGVVSVDARASTTQVTAVQPLPSQPRVFVRQALFEYAPREGLHLSVGRDTLPSGLEIADQATYMRARNTQGLGDVPTQVKLFVWTRRFQVVPYVFGPSGHEATQFRTGGLGVVGETYLLGDTVAAGLSTRAARNSVYDERLVGAFARIGLGAWGVLAEHDVTHRRERATSRTFGQDTSYVQVFVYPVDWFVVSLAAERLAIDAPHRERRVAWRPEVSARISPHLTLTTSLRQEVVGGRTTTVFLVQMFLKTVN